MWRLNTAEAHQQASSQPENHLEFIKIGAGDCGCRLRLEREIVCYEARQVPDSNLWNDYLKHRMISKKLKLYDAGLKKECLVRVYLGSPKPKTRGMPFSLRSFELYFWQHQAARNDARGLEFVLGSSATKFPLTAKTHAELVKLEPRSYTGPKSRLHDDFFHRKIELWLHDSDQVHRITMDEAGVAQAVEAASVDDPYYPKPHQAGNT
ncbi:hypothetical protein F5Y05DRAFT_413937 [Hypoxylon sp. FL0543]|nr:hypothetical protein F5Y05DRAFT_413937 [Hypoxylon sp. FL0543]